MAYSSEHTQRGFVPPQNDREKLVMRRAEDLCRVALNRGIARYTGFLSDREQALAQAAMNRCGFEEYSFQGGYDGAERRLLCIEPAGAYGEPPICCVKIECDRFTPGKVSHKDFLGSLLGLGLDRSCLGDIVTFDAPVQGAYAFALENAAEIICTQLCSVGRMNASAERYEGELPEETVTREICTATVPSLRADAVIAAMIHSGRGTAVQALSSGRVEINHIAAASAHTPVYEGDIFTIRGTGRFKLTAVGGKSRKDRIFIEYFKY